MVIDKQKVVASTNGWKNLAVKELVSRFRLFEGKYACWKGVPK
jgi:hypothetical protein